LRVGLFTYHADFATSEYFARAMSRAEQDVIRLGLRHSRSTGPQPALATAIAAQHQLDRLLFVDPPGPAWPRDWERAGCPTIAYLIDVHVGLQVRLNYAPFFDLLFIAQRDLVQPFHTAGFSQAQWLPLACDPQLHDRVRTRALDVGFVGKTGEVGSRRHSLVTGVLAHFRTNDTRRWHAPDEMADVYAAAKVVFNASINGDLNMRFFEGLAAGALVVTDRIQNGLPELFEEDVHYVGYDSTEEAVEKIHFYLANDTARERIAAAGRAEVLAQHTYDARWRVIEARARELGAGRLATIRTAQTADRVRAYAAVFEQLRLPGEVWRLVSTTPGSAPELLATWARTLARKANARVPFTPGALRARLGARQS
jgi:hypothetical protein